MKFNTETFHFFKHSCSADTDLFPHVSRVQQGELSATFGAFRTTDLAGGAVAMPFSCTLQVCLGLCPTVSQSFQKTQFSEQNLR